MRTIFIVNPAAGQGRLKYGWKSLQKEISRHFTDYHVEVTEYPSHATLLTREALKEGFRQILAVGGDGTLSECVNGFFDEKGVIESQAVLGLIPYGRGSDFSRSLNIPHQPRRAIALLAKAKTLSVDVGRLICSSLEGNQKITRYFINIADVGLVPHVVNWGRKTHPLLGAKASYIYGAIRGALEYRPVEVEYVSDRKEGKEVISNIVVANGKFFGASMKVAPKALQNDGLFDVIVARKMGLSTFLANFHKLYSGRHLSLKELSSFRCRRLSVHANTDGPPLLVEADGDTVGRLPAVFQILPRVLKFKI